MKIMFYVRCVILQNYINRFQEHKKILYYYPPETDIDDKIKEVGLCEAVVQFTK